MTSDFNRLCQMQFLRLEFTLHTLVVAKLDKPLASFDNLLLTGCITFEYITKLLLEVAF